MRRWTLGIALLMLFALMATGAFAVGGKPDTPSLVQQMEDLTTRVSMLEAQSTTVSDVEDRVALLEHLVIQPTDFRLGQWDYARPGVPAEFSVWFREEEINGPWSCVFYWGDGTQTSITDFEWDEQEDAWWSGRIVHTYESIGNPTLAAVLSDRTGNTAQDSMIVFVQNW